MTEIDWHRADQLDVEKFDARTKRCTMNCGPSSYDPRSDRERKFLCADCDAKFLPPNDQGNGPRQAQLAEGPR
jgi:hypothetical protein